MFIIQTSWRLELAQDRAGGLWEESQLVWGRQCGVRALTWPDLTWPQDDLHLQTTDDRRYQAVSLSSRTPAAGWSPTATVTPAAVILPLPLPILLFRLPPTLSTKTLGNQGSARCIFRFFRLLNQSPSQLTIFITSNWDTFSISLMLGNDIFFDSI